MFFYYGFKLLFSFIVNTDVKESIKQIDKNK